MDKFDLILNDVERMPEAGLNVSEGQYPFFFPFPSILLFETLNLLIPMLIVSGLKLLTKLPHFT